MRVSQSVSPSVREPVPVTMLCSPGDVPSPSLPHLSPCPQFCLLLCLDETGESPHHVEGVVYGHVGLRSCAVDRVGVSCMGFHKFHDPYYAYLPFKLYVS
jgi:hypothetical protein